MRSNHPDKGKCPGQSIVEFALMVPIIVLLLAAAIDLGNGYQTWINLTNAAREGARKASGNYTNAAVCTHVNEELTNSGITVACSNVVVSYPGAGGADSSCAPGVRAEGCPVRVTVAYAMPTLTGQVLGFNVLNVSAYMDMVVFLL